VTKKVNIKFLSISFMNLFPTKDQGADAPKPKCSRMKDHPATYKINYILFHIWHYWAFVSFLYLQASDPRQRGTRLWEKLVALGTDYDRPQSSNWR